MKSTSFESILGSWRLMVAGLLVGIVVAIGLLLLLPRYYSSSATIYVSTQSGNSNTASAYQGSLLSAQRVKSYVELATSDRVLGGALGRVPSDLSIEDLRDRTIVGTAPDTVLITISVRDQTLDRSTQLANAVTNSTIDVISDLERPLDRNQTPAVTVRSVQPAIGAPDPVSPNVPLVVLVCVVAGTAVGAAIGELRRRLDRTVRESDDLSSLTAAPALGVTLDSDDAEDRPLVVSAQPLGRASEEYRKIRTNLEYVDVDNPPRLLVITSPLPGEGKTTTLANLALSLRATGRRVVVIDADLRKPRLAELMSVESSIGLTTVLSGRSQLSAVIQSNAGGVDVVASGSIPPNPAEVLGSRQMERLLTELKSQYDVVLIDAPPIALVTDGAVLASFADGAILIGRYGRTSQDDAARSAEAVRKGGGKVVGTVLTCFPPSRGVSYASYGYYRDTHRDRMPDSDDCREGTARSSPPRAVPDEGVTRPQPRPR